MVLLTKETKKGTRQQIYFLSVARHTVWVVTGEGAMFGQDFELLMQECDVEEFASLPLSAESKCPSTNDAQTVSTETPHPLMMS